MLSAAILVLAAAERSSLGSRFDAYVKTARRVKRPILLIATEMRNPVWQDMQHTIFTRDDVKEMLKGVLVLRMPKNDKTTPKIAEACSLKVVRSPLFAFFDYDGKFITYFVGNAGAGTLKATIASVRAVAARRAKRPEGQRVWKKADTSPEAAKLRVAEMYIRNNALAEAKTSLETITREYPGTAEAETAAFYLAELNAGRKPSIASAAPKVPDDGAKDLKMAKMLIANKAAEAAREKLQRIVTDYPGTPAAEEAEKLLSEMP